MKDLTQQYVEQLENMVKDLREKKLELEEENRKLKDKFMLRLAEIYLLPPTSNQMAEYKKWNYSKWYDEVKNQMRKEIKEED